MQSSSHIGLSVNSFIVPVDLLQRSAKADRPLMKLGENWVGQETREPSETTEKVEQNVENR